MNPPDFINVENFLTRKEPAKFQERPASWI
jgi:hypothetical protein